jgi:hypothetical protein
MVSGIGVVPVSYMRVVRCLLMVSGFMMLGGFLVMMGRMLMMLCGLGVVVRSFLRHRQFPFKWKSPQCGEPLGYCGNRVLQAGFEHVNCR